MEQLNSLQRNMQLQLLQEQRSPQLLRRRGSRVYELCPLLMLTL